MVFSYKAVDANGKHVSGTYDAAEKSQVVAYLRSNQMTPVSVTEGSLSTMGGEINISTKPKAKDKSMFCEQFCSLMRAGVTVVDALKMLYEQTKNGILKKGIQTTITHINGGEGLGLSMAYSPKAFDETLVSLVTAGEASGSLDVSLERMATQYKKDAETRATVKKAMMYPIIVLVVAVAVVIFMLVAIVPRFMDMFDALEIEMPKLTLAVVAASKWVKSHVILLIGILVGLTVAIILFKRSLIGKKTFSWLALHLPGINNFTIKSTASRIARTMSTLMAAGMPLPEVLAIITDTMKNYYYKEAMLQVRDAVMEGRSLSSKFAENDKLFPSMLTHMIGVGEDTGDMSAMLTRTAEYYELEVETATQAMMSMLQPAIIILMAGIVGVLVAAVFGPMVKMYQGLGDSL